MFLQYMPQLVLLFYIYACEMELTIKLIMLSGVSAKGGWGGGGGGGLDEQDSFIVQTLTWIQCVVLTKGTVITKHTHLRI